MPAILNNTSLRSKTVRWVLIGILISLSILTGYRFYRSASHYQVKVFQTSSGWGYDILNNGKLFIHQPTIPGYSGVVGFTSQEQAHKVGERVVHKLQETKALPSLTNDELRQLGVKIP